MRTVRRHIMVVAQVLKRTPVLLCNTGVSATNNDESACIEQGCSAVGLQAGLSPIVMNDKRI
ncbi:MAG: hypothetical protein RSB25_06005 [Acinetobacter sp.]